MTITRIAKIRNLGVFREFTWPADLPGFGRYNLVYGWNASGKTTLSNMLRALETRTNISDAQLTVTIDGHNTAGSQFAEAAVPIRVFNRRFMAENVFPTDGDVAPIYVLGEKNVEKQKEANALKLSLAQKQNEFQNCQATKSRADSELDGLCVSRAKTIKDTLGREGNRYTTYDKRRFRDTADHLAKSNEAKRHLLPQATRESLLKQHAATPKPKVDRLDYEFPDLGALWRKVSGLLSTTVVSAVIESLKDDPDLATWAREGLKVHKDRTATLCLFCGQRLPPDRLTKLEAHFNDEYERLQETLDGEIKTVRQLAKSAEGLSPPVSAQLYDHLANEYDSCRAELLEHRSSVEAALSALEQALVGKQPKPFEAQKLDVTLPSIDAKSVDRLNAIVDKHNEACDEFDQRVDQARQQLENDAVASEIDEYCRLLQAVEDAQAGLQSKEKEIQEVQRKINRLEREIVEHREPAEELNRDLANYLGHDELRLDVKDTGYEITRQGQVAEGLSEGETTAVALLYFLKSLRDRRFDLRKGTVVLDDPVSSLDSNALFGAFGFIRERTQDAGQLIVLTHNFSFFRQVRNWFHKLKGQNKKNITDRPARFYMVECSTDGRLRSSTIRWLDPLLERYQSEYHYLFKRVYEAAGRRLGGGLEACYILPNMARRLLETFLSFRHPENAGDLTKQMDAVEFEGSKKQRILRFLHAQSHRGEVGEPEHDLSALNEAQPVMTDLLELIKEQDPKHFAAMEAIVSPSADDETDE